MIDYDAYHPDDAKDILVIEVTGRLDAETSEYLMQCIQGHIEDGARRIVLDCSNLEYLSSLGLGTIVRALLRLKKEDGAVALAGVKGVVAEVLQIAQLSRLLSIYPDVQTAAQSLRAAG